MSCAARRPMVALAAGALVALLALTTLAGCTPGTDEHRNASPTVADLRAKAAMAPCPKPTSLSAATGTATPTPSITPSTTVSPSPGVPAAGASGSSTSRVTSPGTSTSTPVDGQNLPHTTLPCLAGGPDVPLRRLTGVPLVVNLWATWCLPCRTELPAFQAAFAHADPTRLRVLGVATQDPGLTRELSFAVDTGLHMPNLVDDKGVVAAQIGVRGLPATLFVAPDGALVHVYNGPPLTFPALRDLIRRYLRVTIRG